MFHVADNLFFGRLADGRVRVLKLSGPPSAPPDVQGNYPDAVLDQVIESWQWCSVACSVSLYGDHPGQFHEMCSFHNGS